LKETWQRRQGGRLTAEAYTEVGGVAGAIEKTAEDAYQQLTPLQRDAARRLFLRLVTPGEGQADTRARSVIPDDPEQRDIVRLFANPKTRLLVTGYDNTQGSASAGGEPRSTVELAHEALIQRWPTLRDWVRINRDNMRARATVLRGKAEWEEHGEDEKFLLNPGVQLERGRALLQQPGDVAVDDIVYYVVHSIEKDDRRLAAERETALADQKRIADARKRTAQVAVIGLVAALLVAGAALWQYLNATEATKVAKDATARAQASTEQAKTNLHEAKLAEEAADKAKKDALAQRDRAVQAEERARASAEQAQANLNVAQVAQSRFLSDLARERRAAPGGAGTAILLALEALPDITNHLARPYVPEAKLQLDAAWRDLRERVILSGQGADVTRAAFSPDDKRVVTASGDGTARIWDAATGQPVGEVLRGHSGPVVSAAFSPDGKRIVTASMDMTARIWDAATSHQIGEPLAGHKDAVRSAMFSPDGARVVTASWDGTARVWNAATGQPIGQPLMGHQFGLRSAAFSPDGTRIVTAGDDKTARIWDASTDQQIGVWLIGHGAQVVAASFSPDGKRIVTASWDKTARVWDAATGQQIGEPLIVGNELMSAGFSPNGNRIITASVDSMVRLWDTGNGQPIGEPLSGHLSQVNSAAFSPDGSRIVTASNDLTVRIWDAVTGRQVGRPLGGDTSAAFSPDGQRIVTASADKTARVWDAATGQLTEVLLGHQGAVRSAAFSPDGRRIVTASVD
jgi:WD40 repeat protein